MIPTIRSLVLMAPFAALTLATMLTSPLSAQSAGGLSVAIPDDFPAIDASAVVVREGSRSVILLKESEASAETLFVALGVLRRARADRPFPRAGEMLPVLAFALETMLSPEVRDRLEGTLHRLVNARRGNLGSWGAGRVVRMPEG